MVYLSILLLSLYGDLLKHYLPPDKSIVLLYAMALVVLVIMIMSAKRKKSPVAGRDGRIISGCLIFVILLYLFQLLIALAKDIVFAAFSNALYICIPALYCIVILKCYPQFNIIKLAQLFHILMIPINAVGSIQYYVNPDFLISTVYAETGGIIRRNLFEAGSTFLRFPSIFASADRYSAIGLMQCFFAFILWAIPPQRKQSNIFWILFNFVCGINALLISGARSRILLLLFIFALFIFSSIRSFRLRGGVSLKRNIAVGALGTLFFFIPAFYFLTALNPQSLQQVGNYPVIGFLIQSLHEGDVTGRISESISVSVIPEKISFFGEGLGSLGSKPGEFGIMSMWIEGGLLFGCLTLIAFMTIILVLALIVFRAFYQGDPPKVVVFAFPALVLGFGLFTGLTGALELSSGILLMVSLAAIIQYSKTRVLPTSNYSSRTGR